MLLGGQTPLVDEHADFLVTQVRQPEALEARQARLDLSWGSCRAARHDALPHPVAYPTFSFWFAALAPRCLQENLSLHARKLAKLHRQNSHL
jgi:hypothetical protein